MKTLAYLALVLVVIAGGFYLFTHRAVAPSTLAANVKDLTFTISGQPVALIAGVATTPAATSSASMITTRYFGNEVAADLNGDGVEDVAFLVTQEGGGSGTFFYLVGAINVGEGYKGTQAVLIGDRVAPQTTEFRDGLVIVNYADRKPGEPFTTSPSVGKSLYLKYDPATNAFGEVVQNFEGESASVIVGSVSLGPTCPVERNPPDPQCADKPYAASFTLTSADGAQVIKNFSSDSTGKFRIEVVPGTYAIRPSASAPMLPRCAPVGPIEVKQNAETTVTISCDTGIR